MYFYILLTISSIIQASSSSEVSIHTPDEYKYLCLCEHGIDVSLSTLIFKVRACNDAHIGLFACYPNTVTPNFYEIVIGGWRNSRSVIRNKKQGDHKANYIAKDLLDCKERRSFWISWINGVIRVGTGNDVDKNVLMQWHDPNPYDVRYAAVSTGWGSDADWIISRSDSGSCLTNPCQNDGYCYLNLTIDTPMCKCASGWTGKHCEKGVANMDLVYSDKTKIAWNDVKRKCTECGGHVIFYNNYTALRNTDSQLTINNEFWLGNFKILSDWISIVGCFKRDNIGPLIIRAIDFKQNSPLLCQHFCTTQYFGLQGTTCVCLSEKCSLDISENVSLCQYRCPGNSLFPCGGNHQLNIYRNMAEVFEYKTVQCSTLDECLCVDVQCNNGKVEHYTRNCSQTLQMNCGRVTTEPLGWFDAFHDCTTKQSDYPKPNGSILRCKSKPTPQWSSIFRSYTDIATDQIESVDEGIKKCFSWKLLNGKFTLGSMVKCSSNKNFICEIESGKRNKCGVEWISVVQRTPNENTGYIIGIVIGIIFGFLLTLTAVIIVFYLRRRKVRCGSSRSNGLNNTSYEDLAVDHNLAGSQNAIGGDYEQLQDNIQDKKQNTGYKMAKPLDINNDQSNASKPDNDGQYYIIEKENQYELAKLENPYLEIL